MTISPATSRDSHPEGFTTITLEEFVNRSDESVIVEEEKKTDKKSFIPSALIAIDNVLDLIPLGSTASNLIDLSLKHFFFKDADPATSQYGEYLKHLKEKKTTTCLVYSIPLLGTVVKMGALTSKLIQPSKTSKKQDTKATESAPSHEDLRLSLPEQDSPIEHEDSPKSFTI